MVSFRTELLLIDKLMTNLGENVQIIGVGGKYDKKQEHKYKIDSQPQDISSWEATIKKIINKRKNIPGVKTVNTNFSVISDNDF